MHAVEQVIERLETRFSGIPRSRIEAVVREEHRRLEGRPVRDYVSVLIERSAREKLRELPAGRNEPEPAR